MMMNDKEILEKYLCSDIYINQKSLFTAYSSVDKLYTYTNELLTEYPKRKLKDKSVLTITGSGDHVLEAVINGANNIDSIDINIFCKYLSALKIAMIKKYDQNTFFGIYHCFINAKSVSLYDLSKILNEISIYLTPTEFEFWDTYIKYVNKEKNTSNKDSLLYEENSLLSELDDNNLFLPHFTNDINNNRYLNEETYNSLKDKLDSVKINYYDGDIMDAPNILKDKKYDCIYSSNLIQRIMFDSGITNASDLINKFQSIINKNGIIFTYFFNGEGINEIEKFYCDDFSVVSQKKSIYCFRSGVIVTLKRK